MNAASERERELVEYLLGRLPEAERVRLEEDLFEDEALDEQLLAATDELIHAYLRDELLPEDRQPFEAHFLAAPDHVRRLHFMKGLLASVATRAEPRSRRRRAWLAAAAALLLVGLLAVLFRLRDAGPPQLAVRTPSPEPAPSEAPPAPAAPGGDVLRVRLAGGGMAPVTVPISEETRLVRLEVAVDEASPSFDAVLRSRAGAEIWKAEAVTPPLGQLLVLEVPARLLRAAEAVYVLRIVGESLRSDGAPSVVEYPIRIER